MKRIAVLLCGVLSGCVSPAEPTSVQSNSGAADRQIVELIAENYERNGQKEKFEQLVAGHDISIMSCQRGYVVAFSPKDFDGFDGGIEMFVNRAVTKVDEVFASPTGCEGRYRKVSYP